MGLKKFTLWTGLAASAAFVALLYRPDWFAPVYADAPARSEALRAALPAALASPLGLAPRAPEVAATAPRNAGGPAGGRAPVSVVLADVQRRNAPVRIEAIGTVQPVASVVVRPRVDSQVVEVAVADGASVKAGDLILKLDSRQIEAQIKQAEAQLARDRATLEQNERDAERLTQLVARGSGTQTAADNAKTLVQATSALVQADLAAVENLRVQQSYYTIKAPIAGRIGVVALKQGSVARQGETGSIVTTINQLAPIYVAFSMPQNRLPELREAMAAGKLRVQATPQGSKTTVEGTLTLIDNTIDVATGSITARAIFENVDETLWPGQFCNVTVVLRVEENATVVPRDAVQTGQNGSFVFVADGETAKLRPVNVSRIVDDVAVIASGVAPGDKVVIDGQAMLTPNARIRVREPQPAAAPAGAAVTGRRGGTQDQRT